MVKVPKLWTFLFLAGILCSTTFITKSDNRSCFNDGGCHSSNSCHNDDNGGKHHSNHGDKHDGHHFNHDGKHDGKHDNHHFNNSCKNDCDRDCHDRSSRDCHDRCDNSCDRDCSNDNDRNGHCKDRCGSKTVFVPRQLTTDSTLELALNNYHFYRHAACPEDRAFFNFYGSYFHRRSTHECDSARCFLPNGKSSCVIAEDGTGDVNSLWLGLIGAPGRNYRSTLSFAPRRKIDGGYFSFYFDLNNWFCGTWFSISFAAARVEHCLGLREIVEENSTFQDNGNATNVFCKKNNWNGGRFHRKSHSETRVDDVQFKLGYNYFFCNQDHLGLYFVATAPTGRRKHCDTHLFESRVGSKHGSVGVGLNSDYTVWECGNQGLNWMVDLKYRFVLKACELRTFDLKHHGDWSRYMLVAHDNDRLHPQPAVNFLRRPVEVRPGSTIEFWTALHYDWCAWNFEVGYNLWWKDCEKICPRRCNGFDGKVGIFDLTGACTERPTSASTAHVSQGIRGNNSVKSDANFVALSDDKINLGSATHGRSLSHTVYGAFSWNSQIWCMPTMIGFGGSYEFARCRTAFDHWTIWLKTGVSF